MNSVLKYLFRINRKFIHILILCLMCGGTYLLYQRRQPERLAPLASQGYSDLAVREGQIYWIQDDLLPLAGASILLRTGAQTLYRRPVQGGPTEVVVHLDRNEVFDAIARHPSTYGFEWDSLIYSVSPRPTISVTGGGGGTMGKSNPIKYLGTFLPPTHRLAVAQPIRQQRFVYRPQEPGIMHRVRRISVRGGAVKAEIRIEHGTSLCLQEGGDNLFWIRNQPAISYSMTQGHQAWTEVTVKDDLMITSLRDGATRRITVLPNWNVNLQAGSEGVFWSQIRPFPDTHQDLYYYRTATNRITKVDTADTENTAVNEWHWPPVTYGDRLYRCAITGRPTKAEIEPGMYVNVGNEIWSIISINLDGSDRRIVCSKQCSIRDLMVYAGSLYCLMQDPLSSKHTSRQRLYRLHPDRPQPLEEIFSLPEQGGMAAIQQSYCADGYFYFVVEEQQRSLWATLTDDDVNVQKTPVLYRIRLPR